MALMLRARECANSDSCSIDEAEGYLKEVVHIQGSCVAGNLAGQQLCDDIQFASEVISGLRNKIENGGQQLSVAMSSSGAAVLSPSQSSKDLKKNLFLGMGFLYAAIVLAIGSHPVMTSDEVLPFTGQEIWWSIRDGYVLDLVSHFLRHGGLSVGESVLGNDAVALTAQEWMWSLRDGYLGDAVSHVTRNGGLLSDPDAVSAVALTPQEWFWAARDGYLADAISHVYRNGGLLLGDAGVSAEDVSAPFTLDEWTSAAKDGYIGNMVSHWWRNGGV